MAQGASMSDATGSTATVTTDLNVTEEGPGTNRRALAKRIILRICISAVVSLAITLAVAAVLTMVQGDAPKDGGDGDGTGGIDFTNVSTLSSALAFANERTHDSGMFFRQYPSAAPTHVHVVFVHGSGAESRYLSSVAHNTSLSGHAHVYTPNLRGHGPDATLLGTRGQLQYEDQLEDDLRALVRSIRDGDYGGDAESNKVVLAGHSSGGGMVLRMARADPAVEADGYFLVAPFLKYDAPTTRPASGSWTNVWLTRIVGLSILNTFGLHYLNYLVSITFNLPERQRDGNETLEYSYDMMNGFAPHSDYMGDLAGAAAKALHIVAGADDESMVADEYQRVLDQIAVGGDWRKTAEVLPGVGHIDIMHDPRLFAALRQFVATL